MKKIFTKTAMALIAVFLLCLLEVKFTAGEDRLFFLFFACLTSVSALFFAAASIWGGDE